MAKALHVRKGDRVKVITGEDKGAIGEVLAVFPESGRVTVQGVNVITKHVADRYNPSTGQQTKGGMVSSEAPINASNVQLVTRDGSLTRSGSDRSEVKKNRPDGSSYTGTRGKRIARKTGEEI